MRQLIIIGCGAAGMAAAISAAQVMHERVTQITVLEKNDRAGKKIYITGKGRCNVTNACETGEFFDRVVHGKKFLYSAVYGYDAACVQRFFEENGCPLKTERGARVFPVSDHSSDITATLVKKMKALGVQVRYGAEVKRLVLTDERGYDKEPPCDESLQTGKRVRGVVLASGEVIEADAVIIATGGLSYPTTGSTGDGYAFAKTAGHSIEKCVPSLVPFEVAEKWCTDLQGLSLKNVRLYTEAKVGKKKRLFDEQGEMLFTHFGISGPLVLSASTVYEAGTKLPMRIDLKPALSQEQLVMRIERDFEAQRDKQFKNALAGLFPHSLIPVMVMLAQDRIRAEDKAAAIGPKQIEAFAKLIKGVPLTVTGTRSFREAVITRGGVNLKEIDPSTMQSKLCRGLYFAGEVIDADAVTGGYNLQIAWSTGHLAGLSAAKDG